ncbi:MAG: tetratricopeptide repeat protein, partial [Campylobacterales bacterium]
MTSDGSIKSGRLKEALTLYEKALALEPKDATIYNSAAVVAQAIRAYEKAERWYRQAITLKPDYADAYSNL